MHGAYVVEFCGNDKIQCYTRSFILSFHRLAHEVMLRCKRKQTVDVNKVMVQYFQMFA